MENKKCPKCSILKPIADFHKKKTENRCCSWCKDCVYEKQKQRWIDRKRLAVELMGGKCCKCGYNKNYAALHFHHLDPFAKDCDWAKLRLKSWENVVIELEKCVLLCSNCHLEEHNPTHNFEGQNFEANLNANAFLNIKIEATSKCCCCKEPTFGTKFCSQTCANLYRRKVVRPKRLELIELIKYNSICEIGRKYGVSDNAIRKWIKFYDI